MSSPEQNRRPCLLGPELAAIRRAADARYTRFRAKVEKMRDEHAVKGDDDEQYFRGATHQEIVDALNRILDEDGVETEEK